MVARWEEETSQAYGELGEQGHVPILRPVLGELLGRLEGLSALDFACGPGELTAVLAELGARRVLGVDQSPEMIDRARRNVTRVKRHGGQDCKLVVGDESVLEAEERFDVILCSLALMMSHTRERLEAVCTKLLDCVTPGGRVLVILTHPCFRFSDYGTFHYDMPDDYEYWDSGRAYDVVLTPEDDQQPVVITDYHWTIADYVAALTKAGGAVTAVSELPALRKREGTPIGAPAYLALLVRPLGCPWPENP